MSLVVAVGDLARMTEAERAVVLGRLVQATKDPGAGRETIRLRIRSYEQRYEMNSATMKQRLRDGIISETAEIADWLFYLNAIDCGVSTP